MNQARHRTRRLAERDVRFIQLFHQGWDLFAPDPPRCSCEIQVGLNDLDWRPLDASQDHYLATRMARNIAAYLNGGSPFPDTLRVDPLMERAVRGMVRQWPQYPNRAN